MDCWEQNGSNYTHIAIVNDTLRYIPDVMKCQKTTFLPFFGILWHLVHDKKCHKLGQYGYRYNRIALNNPSMGTKFTKLQENPKKFAKIQFSDFPFVSRFTKIGCQVWVKET